MLYALLLNNIVAPNVLFERDTRRHTHTHTTREQIDQRNNDDKIDNDDRLCSKDRHMFIVQHLFIVSPPWIESQTNNTHTERHNAVHAHTERERESRREEVEWDGERERKDEIAYPIWHFILFYSMTIFQWDRPEHIHTLSPQKKKMNKPNE